MTKLCVLKYNSNSAVLCCAVLCCDVVCTVFACQDQMVETLTHVLGHHLFIPEPDQLAKDGKWLSPEALKHKVVVRMKVKPGEFCMTK